MSIKQITNSILGQYFYQANQRNYKSENFSVRISLPGKLFKKHIGEEEGARVSSVTPYSLCGVLKCNGEHKLNRQQIGFFRRYDGIEFHPKKRSS